MSDLYAGLAQPQPPREPFGPTPPGYDNVDPGPTLRARDLRGNPSSTQSETEGLDDKTDRDHPAAGGSFAPPMRDASIQSYDLHSQLPSYDAMAGQDQLHNFRPEDQT